VEAVIGFPDAGKAAKPLVTHNLHFCACGRRHSNVWRPRGTTDERELEKIDPVLSYSLSLRMAVRLVLRELAFFCERETFSCKFIRVARFLKDNAPHVFQSTEMGSKSKNTMDRWLWDLLD
jgi:hypothetical protein